MNQRGRWAEAFYRVVVSAYPRAFRDRFGEELALAAGALLLVVLLASMLPARRASAIDPMDALH